MVKYIHYGSTTFSNDQWNEIKNLQWIKPDGGLWASAVDAIYGWKDWNESSDYQKCEKENSFEFTLSENARILVIDSAKVLEQLIPTNKDSKFGKISGILSAKMYYLDFEKLKEHYDVIDYRVSADRELYWLLYGWDCDSILVLNKEVIVI